MRSPNGTSSRRERIAALHAVLFVRKDSSPPRQRAISRSDLAACDFIVPSDSRPYGLTIRELFENERVPWQRHVHVIDYFPVVRHIVAQSDAIGVTTQEFASSATFAAHFAVVPGDSPFAPAPMCCAVRSRWEPSAPVRAFLHVMQERLPAS